MASPRGPRKSPTVGIRRHDQRSQTVRYARSHRSRGHAAMTSASISSARRSGRSSRWRSARVTRASTISAGRPGSRSRRACRHRRRERRPERLRDLEGVQPERLPRGPGGELVHVLQQRGTGVAGRRRAGVEGDHVAHRVSPPPGRPALAPARHHAGQHLAADRRVARLLRGVVGARVDGIGRGGSRKPRGGSAEAAGRRPDVRSASAQRRHAAEGSA